VDLQHLTWPFFEPRHRDLAAAFADWTPSNLGAFDDDEGGNGDAAREIFQRLGARGWLGATLLDRERDSGPPRLDLRAVCLLREILAFRSVVADVALSEPWLGILPVYLFGSAGLRDRYLPAYLEGRLIPAFALSEPESGSDARAIATTARSDGDHYVLNGRKTWTSNAGLADLYVVFALLDAGADEAGISAFVVGGKTEGIILEERFEVLSPHTVATWRLEDCRIPADCLLGRPGEGFEIAMRTLELFRPTVAAAALGMSRRAMSESIARSLERTAFRKPIAEHQLIQAKLAAMAVQVDAAALLVYRAAWQSDTSERHIAREAAIAKFYSSEAASSVIDQAVQVFGGLGVRKGTVVERLFRHARAFRIFDGTSEIQQLIIAREILRCATEGRRVR
jgi:acyl-CoA dehydrogenase